MPLLDDYMKLLSREMALDEPLQPNLSGNYLLPLDEETSVSISHYAQGFSFVATIGDVPSFKRNELFIDMMVANLFGQGTKKAILGLDPLGKKITLSRHLDHEIGYPEFNDTLEDFINTIDFWKEESRTKRSL